MPIARTTIAGAIAVTSQFKKNLIIKLKRAVDYKEFPSKSPHDQRALRYNANSIVIYSKIPIQLLM